MVKYQGMRKVITPLIILALACQWLPPVYANGSLQISGVIFGNISPPELTIQQVAVNDPLFSQQIYLTEIGAQQAWSTTTGGLSPIAIIDTGIDLHHQDLAGRLWNNIDEVPNNGVDDDHNGYIDDYHGFNFVGNNADIADVHGHGTGIASIIAANTNNGIGMAGINWSAPIMVLKALNYLGGGDFSTVATALRYAVDNGARVVNMSFGAYNFTPDMTEAVNYATAHNVTIVAAVGNNHASAIYYPAAYPDVIAVSSISDTNQLSTFSNYGTGTDLAAPGENIIMAGSSANNISSFVYGSGSSFAAAEVTGAASLLIARNPNLTPAQISDILKSTADPLSGDINGQYFGAGRLNIGRALAYHPTTLTTTLSLSNPKPTADGVASTTVTALITDDFNQPQINLPISAKISGNSNIVNGQLAAEATAVPLGVTDPTGRVSFTLSSPLAETKQIQLSANGTNINVSGSSSVIFKSVSRPRYTMRWLQQSPTANVGVGATTTLWVEVQNTGNVAWTSDTKSTTMRGVMRLGTSRPFDRQSNLYDSSWSSQNRAAFMTPNIVRPGETARFTFNIHPTKVGNYKEYFRPVVDYVTWLNNLGIYWLVNVQ